MEAVHHDPADTGGDRFFKLGGGLVVPVEIHVVKGDVTGLSYCQFASGDNVQPQALLGEYACQRGVDVGLGGIDGLGISVPVSKSPDELLAAGTQCRFVQHV